MIEGQHVLLFLYPPSRLGFTSPVGGPLGEVVLDSSGKYVSRSELLRLDAILRRDVSASFTPDVLSISIVQLERAIRGARKERP